MALKWEWSIARYVIIAEIRGEREYGIDTTGYDNLKALEKAGIDIYSATLYMPAVYPLLEECLGLVPISNRNHLVDIGCGKGRALCVAAAMGYQQLTGIDISEKLCKEAVKNLRITKHKYPSIQFEISSINALDFTIPNTVDSIFLFNPFDGSIMQEVVANLLNSLEQYPRTIYIIYLNPIHKKYFLRAGFQEVHYTRTRLYLEASIFCKERV